MNATIKTLLDEGRLEPVKKDPKAAAIMFADAKKHLEAAKAIAELDPNGSYSLLYDAARKAVAAHMLASGYRSTKKQLGAHVAVVAYAEIELSKGKFKADVASFERMRRNRNKSEYGVALFGQAEIKTDLIHARGIVESVETNWPSD